MRGTAKGTPDKGILDKLILVLATGFGSGRIPKAPGTFGPLAALPLIGLMAWMGPQALAFFLVGFTLFSIWVADQAEKMLGQKDPGCIVIDEMAGICVALCLVPITWTTMALGFVFFRFFDILKPLPVRYFEKNYTGGAGVVLDDIMAGLLSAVLLKMIYLTGVL